MSSEEPVLKRDFTKYPFEFFVEGGDLRSMVVPHTHCSNCYADLPTLTPQAVSAIYAAAKIPVPKPGISFLSANIEISSSFIESGSNGRRIKTTRSLKFDFPLCQKCFYDYLVLKRYEPKLYDPTYKEYPKRKRISLFLNIAGGFSFLAVILGIKFVPQEFVGTLMLVGFILTCLFLPAGGIVFYFSKSFDKKLGNCLISDGLLRYGKVSAGYFPGEKRPGKESNYFKALLNSRTVFHYKLWFRSEQYRDLFARENKHEDPI